MIRFIVRLWRWFRRPRYDYVSAEWQRHYNEHTYNDDPRAKSRSDE